MTRLKLKMTTWIPVSLNQILLFKKRWEKRTLKEHFSLRKAWSEKCSRDLSSSILTLYLRKSLSSWGPESASEPTTKPSWVTTLVSAAGISKRRKSRKYWRRAESSPWGEVRGPSANASAVALKLQRTMKMQIQSREAQGRSANRLKWLSRQRRKRRTNSWIWVSSLIRARIRLSRN